jgi:hypothetical protein
MGMMDLLYHTYEYAYEAKDAELIENYMDTESRILSLQIVEGGVRLGVRQKTDDMPDDDYYIIDKEYFIGTKIWEYYG